MWEVFIGVAVGVLAVGYVIFVIVKSAIDRKNGKGCCGDCKSCSLCNKKEENNK